ncbi:hypothetical protein SBA5_590073 [Candidatus Sulfotelmatomonas gaucii]|uniref:Uncharacterized protein n=1 Tax=Candidatus Sulfuritelmatomonas gaucii TaxID=2043161 RepID=A0A2N9LVZ9_9BACT|nr:hypothetical protein SBA5_590073 [Candidatus Sulfotelmatomonas gaucii]
MPARHFHSLNAPVRFKRFNDEFFPAHSIDPKIASGLEERSGRYAQSASIRNLSLPS